MRADISGAYAHELAGYDFVGDEELLGDDMDGDYLVGAAGRAMTAALDARRVQEGAIIRDVSPTKSREYILGFDSTAVPGSTSANITKRPQVIFRPERVVIPSAVGVDFQVVDIKVGKNSQFSASGEVPAVVFAETSFGVRLKMDTAQVSMDVTISVRNTNAAQRNFTAAIIGPAVE